MLDSQGTIISVGDTGSPITYAEIGEIRDINGLQRTRNVRRQTSLADADWERFKTDTLRDPGQFTITVALDPDDTGIAAVEAAFDANTLKEWKIAFPDSPATEETFQGYVAGISNTWQDGDDLLQEFTVQRTGAVTRA